MIAYVDSLKASVKHLILYSNTCARQNRSQFILAAFLLAINLSSFRLKHFLQNIITGILYFSVKSKSYVWRFQIHISYMTECILQSTSHPGMQIFIMEAVWCRRIATYGTYRSKKEKYWRQSMTAIQWYILQMKMLYGNLQKRVQQE